MHFINAKGILSSNNGMNLYRGCTHGCIYCDARSNCYQFTHAFEDIEVKQNAPQLLEQALRSKRKKWYDFFSISNTHSIIGAKNTLQVECNEINYKDIEKIGLLGEYRITKLGLKRDDIVLITILFLALS